MATTLKAFLRRTLFIRLLLPLMVLIGCVNAFWAWRLYDVFTLRQQEVAAITAHAVESHLRDAGHALGFLAQVAAQEAPLPSGISSVSRQMLRLKDTYSYFDRLLWITEEGSILAAAPTLPPGMREKVRMPLFPAKSLWFDGVSSPYISQETGRSTVMLSREVRSGGEIVAELRLDQLQRLVAAPVVSDRKERTFITDSFGNVLAHPDRSLVARQSNLGDLPLLRDHLSRLGDGKNDASEQGMSLLYRDERGTFMMGSVTDIPGMGWVAASQIPLTTVFTPVIETIMASLTLFLPVFLIIGWLFMARIRKGAADPLSNFAEDIRNVARGDYREALPSEADAFEELDVIAEEFRSMTEIIWQRESEMRRAKELAESANLAKSEFLARMSHEIRTPLSGIMGMTEMVLANASDDRQKEYLDGIRDSGRSLLSVVNDILDLSKIEARRLEIDAVPFNLGMLVESTIAGHQVLARSRGIELEIEIAEEVPPVIVGDSGRVRQIINNLVGNALKFTMKGSVRVTIAPADVNIRCGGDESSAEEMSAFDVAAGSVPGVFPEGQPGPAGNDFSNAAGEICAVNPLAPDAGPGTVLHFSVADTGPGIPRDKQSQIFESFAQINTPSHAGTQGTGLGLTICQQLATLLGGHIWLESETGSGSTFHVILPFGVSSKEPDAVGDTCPRPAGPLRILLAEDNPLSQKYMVFFLENQGHKVSVVSDGEEALRLMAEEDFDCVLMDVEMPKLNGLETTTIVRSGEHAGIDPGIPIIALTAHAMKGDRERFITAGMDGYVTKPIEENDLLTAISRACPPSSGNARPKSGAQQKNEAGSNGGSPFSDWLGPPPESLVDTEQIITLYTRSPEFFLELLTVFFEDLPKKRGELRNSLDAGDIDSAADAAHSMISMTSVIKAAPASARARTLESSLRAGSLDAAREIAGELEDEFDAISRLLEHLRRTME